MRITYWSESIKMNYVDAFSRSKSNPLSGNVHELDLNTLTYKAIGYFEADSEEDLRNYFMLDDEMMSKVEL